MTPARAALVVGALLAALPAVSRAAPPGRAVVVGVGRYADPALPDLEGPPHDARAMRALLVERFGFAPGDVTLLVDEEATRDAILRALARLVWGARPGQPTVFYFSGHGTRVFDASGDEPDGWDEGLVPHDSGRDGRPNRDLLDDELHGILRWLTERGAIVTFVYDSCHAGTGTRDPLARVAPADDRPRFVTAAPLDDTPAGWTLLAAAREDQLAFEKPLGPGGARRGLFTWALVDGLRSAPPGASLRDVFDLVRAGVRQRDARQDPQLEGPALDRAPFGAALRPPAPHVAIELDPEGPVLQAGAAHGVRPGALYAIGPPGSRSAPGDAATARVTEVGATTARLEVPGAVAAASRAFLVSAGPPGEAIPIQIALDGPLAERLREALTQPAIRFVAEPSAARIALRGIAGRLRIEGPDGRLLDAMPMPSDAIGMASMASRVMPWVRWHAIDGLSSADDGLAVDFTAAADGPARRGAIEVAPGRTLTLTVANDGSVDLYITVLALAPDGSVTVVYPLPGSRAYVQAFGRWQQSVEAALPPGVSETVDRLKLIATTAPTDFRFLQQGPAGDGAKGLAPLGTLADLWSDAGLGARPRGVSAGRWTARTIEITTR